MNDLKLFVWDEVLEGHGPGIAAAVATHPDEARKKILDAFNAEVETKDENTKPLWESDARGLAKEIALPPSRILDLSSAIYLHGSS